jgi:hypothetical protein
VKLRCPLFENSLFRLGIESQLSKDISVSLENSLISLTGIPPHVAILKELCDFRKTLQSTPEAISEKMREIMERNAEASGTITREYLTSALEKVVQNISASRIPVSDTESGSHTPGDHSQLFLWGGRFRRLPEDFAFPQCNLLTAMHLWFEGNVEKRLPPLSTVSAFDFSCRKQKRILSEWNCVIKEVRKILEPKQKWINKPSSQQIINMYNDIQDILFNIGSSFKNRRLGQIHVTTLLKLLRKSKDRNPDLGSNIEQ